MEDKIKELHDFLGEMELKLKKISEELNRKPREFWLTLMDEFSPYEVWTRKPDKPELYGKVIHVREVIDE